MWASRWPWAKARESSATARESAHGGRPGLVDDSVYRDYRGHVTKSTTIRVSRATHARVTALAAERHESIDETVNEALRALRQDAMGRDLATDLTDDEVAWLDADAG